MDAVLNLIQTHIDTVQGALPEARHLTVKRILEALFFSTNEPLTLERLKEIIQSTYPLRSVEIKALVIELQEEYKQQKRGFQLDEIAQGYLLRTVEEVSPFVEQLHRERRSDKLSRAATEILAIIAYRQPITRREIEALRGVDSSGVLAALLERNLIEPVGRKDVPGRPIQYGVTKIFLHHFGFKEVNDFAFQTQLP